MQRRHRRAMLDPMLALQALVPRSSLESAEALTVAEVQATALVKLACIKEPPVPILDLANFLGVVTEREPAANVLGTHRMRGGVWHVGYGASTPAARDATVAHQLKLILDEPFGDRLYPPSDSMPTAVRKHHVAEYFAVCLTMPAHWVEQSWHDGERDLEGLAGRFGTSSEAMQFRIRAMRLL